jgi:hypothetical protein
MFRGQYLMFYNYFGKFREPPVEGLLLKNYGKGGGASGSLPFFVGNSSCVQEINRWICTNEIFPSKKRNELLAKLLTNNRNY